MPTTWVVEEAALPPVDQPPPDRDPSGADELLDQYVRWLWR